MNNKSTNVVWEKSLITRQDREALNGHKSFVLWFTGLSGSGKSTLAHAVEKKLHEKGCRTFVLDGDNVRHGLSSNLSFSEDDRKENIRRIGEAAKLMTEAGIIALTAFISPFRADREMARNLFPHGEFIEVYCNASLEVCESRDVKGLYKKARAGEIKNYTGVDSPYEAPINPEISVASGSEELDLCVEQILETLRTKGLISS
ncbi:adenylyl-sulfate kinase [Alphaproteobacteria bacterium LSUCC0684]